VGRAHGGGRTARPPGRTAVPRQSRVLLTLLVAEVAVFAVSTVPGVRSGAGFDPLLDGWLQAAGYVTAAAVAVLRPVASAVQRVVGSWLAAALVARAAGFALYLGVVRQQQPRRTRRWRTRRDWPCTA